MVLIVYVYSLGNTPHYPRIDNGDYRFNTVLRRDHIKLVWRVVFSTWLSELFNYKDLWRNSSSSWRACIIRSMSCTSRVALAMPRLPCLECTFCENVSWNIAQWSAVSHARVKSPVSRQNIEQSSQLPVVHYYRTFSPQQLIYCC